MGKCMRNFNVLFLMFLLAGCGTPETIITNIQPESYEVPAKNIILFEQSNDATWNDLLTMFANSEFRIDKINMNAHHVTLRYTGQPNLYFDCGKKIINTEGNEVIITNAKRLYSYRAYQYIHLETYSVKNDFTGYVNLLVTGNDVLSQVSIQVDLELKTNVERITTRGRQFKTNRNESLQLNSYRPVQSELFNTNCMTTGKLEKKTFEMISLMHGVKK
jgi:hypothetical protein